MNSSFETGIRQNKVTPGTIGRSLIFYMGLVLITVTHGTVSLCLGPFLPFNIRHRFVNLWSRFIIFWARVTCGVRYEITGRDNIPDNPCVVLAKHQSSWETYILQLLFRPQTTVLKKELTRIPVFGWALRLLDPIIIDRSKKMEALKLLVQQGIEKLKIGRWVVIYPEGTRNMPGARTNFNNGAGLLAKKASSNVLPIAHNAGECWPTKALLLTPGRIRVSIGPPIATDKLNAKEIVQRAQLWIDSEMLNISGIQRRHEHARA